MARFAPKWFLCGGWAVDAWVGQQTRDHVDVDITIFEEDQRSIFDHLDGWLLVAHDQEVADDTSEPWDGRRLWLPAHVHAHPEGDELFALEILFNERWNGDWILSRGLQYAPELSRGPRIAMPIANCARTSGWGLPTVVPEVLLFYKATAYFEAKGLRPHDEDDFRALAPLLDEEARSWLQDVVGRLYPGHPWLERLSSDLQSG